MSNEKLFKKIVREHNEKTGFNFKLPVDADLTGKYAHPVHTGNGYKLTSQTDESNNKLYAIAARIDGMEKLGEIYIDDSMTDEQIATIIKSDSFKNRLESLKALDELRKELDVQAIAIVDNIFTNVIKEREREDTYDIITMAARKLYRDKS